MTIYLPSGTAVPRAGRAPAPTGKDLRLADRRLLRCTEHWRTPPPESQDGFRYQGPQRLTVIVTLDPTPAWGPLLHLSASYPDHDPDWATLRALKDAFLGDRDGMLILPKAADYVNVHPHCFHLWETPEAWGLR